MKSKRFLALFLVVISILTMFPANSTSAADMEEKEVTIYWDGRKVTETVLVDVKGVKYVPISWMYDYGALNHTKKGDNYEFFYPGEEKLSDYSRRVYINEKDLTFSIKVYCPQDKDIIDYMLWLNKLSKDQLKLLEKKNVKNYREAVKVLGLEAKEDYYVLDKGVFLKAITTYDDQVWVPMEQLLPLMNVNCSVQEGCLFMDMRPISIWQILYKYDMEDVLFDIDKEFKYHKELSAAGYAVDTLLNLNLYRTNILTANYGKKIDYEKIFGNYLVDNETYLKAYSTQGTPMSKYYDTIQAGVEEGSTASGIIEIISAWADDNSVTKALGDAGAELSEFVRVSGIVGDAVEGFMWAYDYANAYENMVADHRDMLFAVYDHQVETHKEDAWKIKMWPSYKAAQNVAKNIRIIQYVS